MIKSTDNGLINRPVKILTGPRVIENRYETIKAI